VLDELPEDEAARVRPVLARAREWLRQTQNDDGSWGFYGQPTIEETAYALLALAHGPVSVADRQRCLAGLRFLRASLREPGESGAATDFPPLWIDKCLYTPTLVVRAVIEAAMLSCSRFTDAARRESLAHS
jgi:hypothetical protein